MCGRRGKRRSIWGILMLYIIYGKDRRALMDTPGCIGDFLYLTNCIWIIGILGLFFQKITVAYLLVLASYPVAIAVWAVIARRRYRKVAEIHAAMDRERAKSLNEQETELSDEVDLTQPVLAKYLVCPDCGRRQLSSRTGCWNCKRVFEEQDYEYE